MDIVLSTIRDNARRIAEAVGVPVMAVVKADAYGFDAAEVAATIADVVDGFCVFSVSEAAAAKLWDVAKKPILAIGPPDQFDAGFFISQHVRPAVTTAAQAEAYRSALPVLCVDTGMQRFACPPEMCERVIDAGQITEAFTHAIRAQQAARLVELLGGRGIKLHAAASGLMNDPSCRLDAVRPGLALYANAARIATPLVEARDSRGPIGYTGFSASRHGAILCGYSNGLRPGPCIVNGVRRRIPEVGMQSSFVELGPADKVGDEVILLGDGLTELDLAAAWGVSPQNVLIQLTGAGPRSFVDQV